MRGIRSMKLPRWAYIVAVALSITMLAVGCGSPSSDSKQVQQPTIQSKSYFIFDTMVTVKLYDDPAYAQHFEHILNIMKDIESKMSRTLETSELYKLNTHAGKGPYQVSDETFMVIEKALDYAEKTNGRFDPTIGPLVSLWGIGTEQARVPAQAEIDEALKLVGYDTVTLDAANKTVSMAKPGMELDLGGIGKGYAADAIVDYIREQGVKSAIIDLGGNIYAVGTKPAGFDWTIGVQDPNETRGNQIGTMKIKDRTIVTSGVYERYLEHNGQYYHHILDPKTGYPAKSNLNSVTIVTDRSTDADALSTSAFALGVEEGIAFIEAKPNAEAIFITEDKQVYTTSGIPSFFTLTDDAYKYKFNK
ncbi:FAD:protein FMN transferase [Paenibacillus assamensis]|uniref:FAD:protein FMN transferase n=1 Tax=Paenibacillus assamensis TaxID=311244 RepID=UPI0004095424|nr:FAD:protein FMN transferase [Paenibacillus assamensis]